MHALYPADHADRTATARYFEVGDRLDHATIADNKKRMALLSYAKEILLQEARKELAEERARIHDNINDLFRPILESFKASYK